LPAQVAAQGEVDQEMVKRGLDPRTGQPLAGANQPPVPVKDENGLWIDQNTGKAMPEAAQKRLDQQDRLKKSVDEAHGLEGADSRNAIGRFFGTKNTAVYGWNPTTGEYRTFDIQDDLNKPKNKQFRALTPEQQKAYEEGNKTATVQPATGMAGAMAPTVPVSTQGPSIVNKFPPQRSAAGSPQEGQTATNPKTGEKLIFRGGQWVKT